MAAVFPDGFQLSELFASELATFQVWLLNGGFCSGTPGSLLQLRNLESNLRTVSTNLMGKYINITAFSSVEEGHKILQLFLFAALWNLLKHSERWRCSLLSCSLRLFHLSLATKVMSSSAQHKGREATNINHYGVGVFHLLAYFEPQSRDPSEAPPPYRCAESLQQCCYYAS